MSEIRDRAIENLGFVLSRHKSGTADSSDNHTKMKVDEILAIPELAIVDRGADIPRDTRFWRNCWRQRCKPAKICLECPFFDYKTHTLKGWVKEIKE